jgi:hypothetical protein
MRGSSSPAHLVFDGSCHRDNVRLTGRIALVVATALLGLAIGYTVTSALSASTPVPVEPIELDSGPEGSTPPASSTTTAPGGAIVVPPPTLGPAPTQPSQPTPSTDDDDDHLDDDDENDDDDEEDDDD